MIQQNLPGVVSLVSQSFYDASWGGWGVCGGAETMSLLLSTGVSSEEATCKNR